jgi:CheY-like chemotaxis protein
MLGLTSYQEALRAIGRLCEPATEVRIIEGPDRVNVEIGAEHAARQLRRADLEQVLLESAAHRGDNRAAGPLSDVLRSVGLALDEVRARDVCLVLSADQLSVRFSDDRELSYAGDELEALRTAAAARRNGQPLSRVLILEAAPDTAAHLREPLVAEFAVQTVPTLYARAVAGGLDGPDLVLTQLSEATVEAIQTLRSGLRSAELPVVVIAGADCAVDAGALFGAGADDLLQEPVQPALLRARIRTWLLRRR